MMVQRQIKHLLCGITILVLLGGGVAFAVPVNTVGNVNNWNVGSGQLNGDFQVVKDEDFPGGPIQLGIRTSLRNVGNVIPSGNLYSVPEGPQPPTTDRAKWNFDLHIYYEGEFSDLTSLSLSIAPSLLTPGATPPFAPIVDLLNPILRGAIDCHSITPTACASGAPFIPPTTLSSIPHTPDPANFYQSSQNPTFGWFGSSGDAIPEPGLYEFTLTAERTNDFIVSTNMVVKVGDPNVIPEPSTYLLFGTGLVGVFLYRRWQTRLPQA